MATWRRFAQLVCMPGVRLEGVPGVFAAASHVSQENTLRVKVTTTFHSYPSAVSVTGTAPVLPKVHLVSHGACSAGNGICSRTYAMQAVDQPWHDKIGNNFRRGNEKVINTPVDELSEHVSITNEIEKSLSAAASIDDVMDMVEQHQSEFEGPNVATALMTLHHLTDSMSPEEHRNAVHSRSEFKRLIEMVEEPTFDAFTLMQTLQALVGLHVQDEQLLSNVSARLTGLVQASDAKQLMKLIKRLCQSEYVPTRDFLEAVHRRVNAIKGKVHPETCIDVERAVTKLAAWMSEGRSKQKAATCQ